MLEFSAIISFLNSFGSVGVFLSIALGGEILLLAAGALSSFGYLNFLEIILAAAVGVVLVDSLWYLLGRTGRKIVFLKNLGKKFIRKESYDHWEKQFGKYSVKTILFLRLIYGFRAFILMAAGAAKMKFSKFFIFNLLGSLIWATIFTLLGYFFGHSFNLLKNMIENIYLFVPAAVACILIIILLIYFLKRKLNFKS
ncbi:MAG: DedA family protein [Patescibacteria group bacterium]